MENLVDLANKGGHNSEMGARRPGVHLSRALPAAVGGSVGRGGRRGGGVRF